MVSLSHSFFSRIKICTWQAYNEIREVNFSSLKNYSRYSILPLIVCCALFGIMIVYTDLTSKDNFAITVLSSYQNKKMIYKFMHTLMDTKFVLQIINQNYKTNK